MREETDVLQKVKKLLNVAERGDECNIDEAETAMIMAQKLLRKYHLSMSKVLEFDAEQAGTDTEFLELKEEEAASFKANVIPKWMMSVIMAVNRVTQTKTLINRTPRVDSAYGELRIVFVGDSIDVYSATELFNYLRTTITKLSSKHRKAVDGKFKHWRSFAEGCSETILNRSKLMDSKIDKELNKIFGMGDIDCNLDVSNFELDDDDDEYEVIDDDVFDEILKDEHALVLYGKYKHTKLQQIANYLEDKEVEEESKSSTTAKTLEESYMLGSEAGEEIPLAVAKKIKK